MKRRLASDQSLTIAISFLSAVNLQPVADPQSLTSQRVVGDRLATTEPSSSPKSFAVRLLCMLKGQLATDSR